MTLAQLLKRLRAIRAFDVSYALEKKCDKICSYFADNALDAAVVGVSGGIDSALVLALLMAAKNRTGSPLKRVVGIRMPIAGPGASGQSRATRRGALVVEAAGAEDWFCDLSRAQEGYVEAFSQPAVSKCGDPWAEGQLLSVARTPALYYAAALLQSQGNKSLVVGTTNRDEGAYIGFFGKASDAMVDLQPISDLHKSEVYSLSKTLGIPNEIIDATPRGDVHDARTDEQMIGAPYWFVEMHALLHSLGRTPWLESLSTEARLQYEDYESAIETLHNRNAHKYRVGSPAVHLDVYPRAVPGGWS